MSMISLLEHEQQVPFLEEIKLLTFYQSMLWLLKHEQQVAFLQDIKLLIFYLCQCLHNVSALIVGAWATNGIFRRYKIIKFLPMSMLWLLEHEPQVAFLEEMRLLTFYQCREMLKKSYAPVNKEISFFLSNDIFLQFNLLLWGIKSSISKKFWSTCIYFYLKYIFFTFIIFQMLYRLYFYE